MHGKRSELKDLDVYAQLFEVQQSPPKDGREGRVGCTKGTPIGDESPLIGWSRGSENFGPKHHLEGGFAVNGLPQGRSDAPTNPTLPCMFF